MLPSGECRGDIQPGWHKQTLGAASRGLPSAMMRPPPRMPAAVPPPPGPAKKKSARKQVEVGVEASAPSQATPARSAYSTTGYSPLCAKECCH